MNSPWYKQKIFIIVVISLSVFLVAGFTTFLIIKNNSDKVAQKSSNSSQNSSSSANDSKVLALQRFNLLTKNISPQEFAQLSQTSNTEQQSARISDRGLTPTTGSTSQTTTLGKSGYAAELFQEKQLVDDTIFYTETENIYNSQVPELPIQPLGSEMYQSSSSSNSKTSIINVINTKTWYSLNNYKSVVSENGKLVSISITTPTSGLTYLGGKYAIRDNYNETNYLSGVYSGSLANQELNFLKQILQDPNIKKTGSIFVDGKNLDVYELSSDYDLKNGSSPTPPISAYSGSQTAVTSSTDSSDLASTQVPSRCANPTNNLDLASTSRCFVNSLKTKYYVDQSNFSLYLVEYYNSDGKTISSSVKTIQSQELKNSDFSVFTKVKEDSQIPIKDFNTNEIYDETGRLENFLGKYTILYSPKYSTKNISISDYDTAKSKEYNQARDTVDFDPNFANYNQPTGMQPFGYSGQSDTNTSISFSFYKNKPKLSDLVLGDVGSESVKNTKVIINEQELPAETISTIGTGTGYDVVLFNYNKYWVQINTYTYNPEQAPKPPVSEVLKLSTLPLDEAKRIDNYRAEKVKNTVFPQPTSIEKLEPKTRLLLGDLTISNLQLTSVLKANKVSDKCTDFIDYEYEIESCLTSKYNGFSLSYFTNLYNNSPVSTSNGAVKLDIPGQQAINSVIATILPTEIDQEQIETIFKKLNQGGSGVELVISKTGYGYTITPKQSGYNRYYIFTKNSQTIILNISQYVTTVAPDQNNTQQLDKLVNEIINQIGVDKDIDILKKQLEKNNQLFTTGTSKI